MMHNKAVFFATLITAFVLIIGNAHAVGITAGTFRDANGMMDVEQGKTAAATVILTNSPNRDNHFIISVSDEIAGWVTSISPNDFDLSAGATKSITIAALVPYNASATEHHGTVTATGTQIIGSGGLGYMEAAKSTLYLFVKQGSGIPSGSSGGGSAAPTANATNATNTTAGGSGRGNETNTNMTNATSGGGGSSQPPSNTTANTTQPLNNTADCPAYYTCANGTQIPYCSIVVQRDTAGNAIGAGCGCITPQCPSSAGGGSAGGGSSGGGAAVYVLPSISGGGSGGTPAAGTGASGSSSAASATTPPSAGSSQAGSVPDTAASGSSNAGGKQPAAGASQTMPIVKTVQGNRGGLLQTSLASAEYVGTLNVEASKVFMDTSLGKKQITVMPEDAIRVSQTPVKEDVVKLELREVSQKPVYSVTGLKKGKLFSIISLSVEVETQVDAEDGRVISVSRPWWSFLVR